MKKSILENFKLHFGLAENSAPTINKKIESYSIEQSISHHLPWLEYDSKSRCFLLQDGVSVAGMFEIESAPCDSSPESYLSDLRDRFMIIFKNTIPQELHSPWHLQFYLQDEEMISSHLANLKKYINEQVKETEYTKDFIRLYSQHCKLLSSSTGIFKDTQVTGNTFKGRRRVIRLIIYRHITKETKLRRGQAVVDDLNSVASKIEHQLTGSNLKVRRCGGKDFYEWMVRWFNPRPSKGRVSTDDLLELQPYPGDENTPFGYDFSEQLFKSTPVSNHEQSVWYFDGVPHKLLTIQSLSSIPKVGHITAERKQGKQSFALFDRMPEGSIFVMNVVVEHQTKVVEHINRVSNSCVGGSAESKLTKNDCQNSLYQVEQGNYLFPTAIGVYIKGDNIERLDEASDQVETIFINNGFIPLNPELELAPCDAYLRFLPMSFNYEFDAKKGIRRSRYIYSRQIANLLPLYGRYRGTNNPCILRWNRGGEPLCFDPFNSEDKSANSHMLYLAETGGGKSASLVWDLKSTIAVHNPRVFIIEAGDSFKLFCDDAESHGKEVNQVKLSMSNPTSLNPFADAFKILDENSDLSLDQSTESISELVETLRDESIEVLDEIENEERDILGEMALATQLMITGGDRREEEKFTRANRAVVLEALIDAAKFVKDSGRNEVVAEDVICSLRRIAKKIAETENNPAKVMRITDMADSMMNFTSDKFSASFFNKPGTPWPEADITRLDMGLMKNDQYGAQLSLAVMGMLTRIAHMAETTQYQQRKTVILIDESHVITRNPLTAASITQFSKMCRKLGIVLWFATQNIGDFPDESRKMLSMIEFWVGLGTSESEIDEMMRFKNLTCEEKALFMSVHKDIPNYVEGFVMGRKVKGLFRNVPPRIALSLGMTEKEEKARRLKIMRENSVSELEAARVVAKEMISKLVKESTQDACH